MDIRFNKHETQQELLNILFTNDKIILHSDAVKETIMSVYENFKKQITNVAVSIKQKDPNVLKLLDNPDGFDFKVSVNLYTTHIKAMEDMTEDEALRVLRNNIESCIAYKDLQDIISSIHGIFVFDGATLKIYNNKIAEGYLTFVFRFIRFHV